MINNELDKADVDNGWDVRGKHEQTSLKPQPKLSNKSSHFKSSFPAKFINTAFVSNTLIIQKFDNDS